MGSLVLQSLPEKCLDSVVGSNLESLADLPPIREEEVSLGVTALADNAFEDFSVVRSSNELKIDLVHGAIILRGYQTAVKSIPLLTFYSQ